MVALSEPVWDRSKQLVCLLWGPIDRPVGSRQTAFLADQSPCQTSALQCLSPQRADRFGLFGDPPRIGLTVDARLSFCACTAGRLAKSLQGSAATSPADHYNGCRE